ncbi:lysosomal thioesterase PPT2 homolog isoform X2 [Planococcus citri]
MAHQVSVIGADLLQISALHPEGFHLIGYSQGGLLSRAVLEFFPMHLVRNFISLSSPQAGQYGTNMLHIFFPNLAKEEAYKVFYSKYGQYLSVANYWNDPHHQDLFYKICKFLPSINNEIPLPNNTSQFFKRGITKLKKMILIGGPDDGTIEPWQSSHFSYYNENETVIPYKERRIYQEDLFGLRTLDERGALHVFTANGVKHHFWYRNTTVIKKYILPWLN